MPPENEDRQNEMEREQNRAEADLEDKQPAGDMGPEDATDNPSTPEAEQY